MQYELPRQPSAFKAQKSEALVPFPQIKGSMADCPWGVKRIELSFELRSAHHVLCTSKVTNAIPPLLDYLRQMGAFTPAALCASNVMKLRRLVPIRRIARLVIAEVSA